ncbi:MAG: hypothetical protein ACPGU1_11085 [Myxococcota bacterium]
MTLRTLTLLLMTLSLALSTVACGDDATTDDTTTDAAGDEAGADDAAGDEAGADDAAEETEDDAETPWGAVCATDADCAAPTDFCVMQPGATEGYCSIECPNLGADCTYEDWTCNIVGTCNAPMATWCGPPSEIEEGGGVVVACE